MLFSFLAIGFLAACGGEDPECVQSDYVGTWVGTEDCTLMDSVTVTFEIVTGLNDDQVVVSGGAFVADALNVEECKLEGGFTALGSGVEFSGSLTGDKLVLKHQVIAFGTPTFSCDYLLTRQ